MFYSTLYMCLRHHISYVGLYQPFHLSHSETEIVDAFKEYDARIVFGAETTCWPDRDLAEEYPKPANGGDFR